MNGVPSSSIQNSQDMQLSKNYIKFRKEGAQLTNSEQKIKFKQDYSSYPDDIRVEEFEEFADTIDEQLTAGHPINKEYKFSVIDEIGKGSSCTSSMVENYKGSKMMNFDSSERLKKKQIEAE